MPIGNRNFDGSLMFISNGDVFKAAFNATKNETCPKPMVIRIPDIKKVIYNNPATIICWEDGTKTVVKCSEGDTYDTVKEVIA